ncbi:MAG TPA: ribonuclease H, partial [Kofleriaceae bacterium]|nr:ribonuclease H [Kofleriaceae bacterium]
ATTPARGRGRLGKTLSLTDPLPVDAVHVWTDGACTGNPGPAGLGVVVLDGDLRREHKEYLGHGTNNIAELTAVLRGLDMLDTTERPVLVYTDSSYAIGVLSLGWKAKANTDLVAEIRDRLASFTDVRFVKVPGHAGVVENERCDELARAAITSRR